MSEQRASGAGQKDKPPRDDLRAEEAGSENNPLGPSLQLLWHGLPAPHKGPRPKLSLDQIVAAGIALADAEGESALSMRTLARDLDVGTMSLYRYVPSKTELLSLMLDAVAEPSPEQAEAVGTGWRPCLEAAAWRERRMYLAHPWTLQTNWSRPVMGPNSMATLDLTLEGLRDLPLSDQEKMGAISSVGSFVLGAVRSEILWQESATESGLTDDEFWSLQTPAMEAAMGSGNFPHMAALAEDTFDASWDDSFTFGLTMLLDGVEQTVLRRRTGSGTQTQ